MQSQPHLPLHLSHPFHNHNPLHNSHPPLIRYPYNAEARLRHLTDTWITPVGKHFVRNHCSVNAPLNNAFSLSKPPPSPLPPQVPDIDPETYRLTVAGVGLNTTTFTLSDLKTKFPRVEIASVIQVGVLGFGFRVLGFGFWVLGFGFWVLGLGLSYTGWCLVLEVMQRRLNLFQCNGNRREDFHYLKVRVRARARSRA